MFLLILLFDLDPTIYTPRRKNVTNTHRITRQRSDISVDNNWNRHNHKDKNNDANKQIRNQRNIETKNKSFAINRQERNEHKSQSNKNSNNTTQSHSRRSKNEVLASQSTPDLDLFNLKVHESNNNLEILSHRKTRKLISTDLNSIIIGSTSPVRGQPARHLRNGKRDNSG